MSEKAEKKAEAAPAPAKDTHGEKKPDGAKKGAGGGLLAKTPVLLGIVMVIEAVVLFAGFKFLGGGPKAAVAVDLVTGEKGHDGHGEGHGDGHGSEGAPKSNDKDKSVEVLQDFKADNSQNGRHYRYVVSISLLVKADAENTVKEKIKSRGDLIKHHIRTLIGQIDPDKLSGGSEPGLDTFRHQIKSQLEIIIGEGMIEEVLVPTCTVFRADY